MSLDHLTEEQSAAATSPHRLVRVRAGAGTGKTTALVGRATYLIEHEDVPADHILAITFSRRAAKYMQTRMAYAGVKVLTIHALGFRLIQKFLPGYDVVTGWKQRLMIAKAIRACRSSAKIADVANHLHAIKSRGQRATRHQREIEAYQQALGREHLVDYDDLILVPGRGMWDLADDAEKLSKLRQWSHILVDEAQDTSGPQWNMIVRLVEPYSQITGEGGSLWVCGDWQQSMYGFRGADPDMFLTGLDKAMGEPVEEYLLTRNYRSLPGIVAAANATMLQEPGALRLKGVKDGDGQNSDVQGYLYGSVEAEAMDVARMTANAIQSGISPHEIAILTRTNAALEPFQRHLCLQGIPAFVVGNRGFYDRQEIMDLLAYIRLSQGWDEDSAERVVSRPVRYLGKVFLEELHRRGGWKWVARAARSELQIGWSRGFMGDNLTTYWGQICELQAMAKRGATLSELVEYVCFVVGYQPWLMGEEADDVDDQVLENLVRFRDTVLTWTESIPAFLAFTEQLIGPRRKDDDLILNEPGKVQLSTVHKAKGLEWKVVFGVQMTEGILPHARSESPEEERRIGYVLMTRAQERLIMTGTEPLSRFITELPDRLVQLGAEMGAQYLQILSKMEDPDGPEEVAPAIAERHSDRRLLH